MSEEIVVSKNVKRNMMMVIVGGKTRHIPIDDHKPALPQTGTKNPKGGKKQKVAVKPKEEEKAVTTEITETVEGEDDTTVVTNEKIQKRKKLEE